MHKSVTPTHTKLHSLGSVCKTNLISKLFGTNPSSPPIQPPIKASLFQAIHFFITPPPIQYFSIYAFTNPCNYQSTPPRLPTRPLAYPPHPSANPLSHSLIHPSLHQSIYPSILQSVQPSLHQVTHLWITNSPITTQWILMHPSILLSILPHLCFSVPTSAARLSLSISSRALALFRPSTCLRRSLSSSR